MIEKNRRIFFNLGVFLVFVIFISSSVLFKTFGDMDEIWNYNFARCMSNGMVPYRDFNMVQTPLFAFIMGIFLKIFGSHLIVMRIFAILIDSAILFLVYKITEKLEIKRSVSLIVICGFLFLLNEYFYFDYNFLSIFISLFIIYFEIILENENLKKNVLIGILGGLVFLSKQTIGAFVCFSIVFYEIIFAIYNYKLRKKIEVKKIFYTILGISVPLLIILIYLLITKSFLAFIDYAIMGIKTFSNSISYIELIKRSSIAIKILSVYIPISFVIMLDYIIYQKDKKLLFILLISLADFVVVCPISDRVHFLIGTIPSLVGNIYILNKLIKKINKKLVFFIVEYIACVVFLYVFSIGIYNNYINFKQEKNYSSLKHFEGIPIDEALENRINEIDEYIKNSDKKVYILNFDAAIYMIPLDFYNKDYDMFLKGNLGSRAEEGQIEKIENEENSEFLILNKENSKNWQHPDKVTDYVEENFENFGSVNCYEIYSKE